MPRHRKPRKEKDGSFLSSETGSLEIELGFKPTEVSAVFGDPCPPEPNCYYNPDRDKVDARAELVSGEWVLQLAWTVAAPRLIKWRAVRK